MSLDLTVSASAIHCSLTDWAITVYDNAKTYHHHPDTPYWIVTLVSQGLLLSNPLHPTIAFTMQTLEVFHQLCLRSPHVSIQAWVGVICDLHKVCDHMSFCGLANPAMQIVYQQYLHEQFTWAFDTYLAILCHISAKVDTAMGQDTKDWHMRNACPSCLYKVNIRYILPPIEIDHVQLDSEPALNPPMIIAFDGNNSLK